MRDAIVFFILAIPSVGAYAMYAIGIVVIYQASRVLNLGHGAMATVPAFLAYTLATGLGIPTAGAALAGVIFGAALGVAIERAFVRRLRHISPTAQTVGTVAAFGICISLTAKIWGTAGRRAPHIVPEGSVDIWGSPLFYGQIGLFVVALVAAGGLFLLFQTTDFGLAMRGAAQNRRAASLMGIDPDRTTTAAWALGGMLAALAGILLAPVTLLHPYSLSLSVLPAFVAALIGGLESLPGAVVGSAVVGVLLGFVPVVAQYPGFRLVFGQVGGTELALAAVAMVVMALRGQRFVATDVRADIL